ncbi:DUF3224 domain-containing protein [Streptomyces griseocarneus]|uniref:DUF3224 domain-containing protein n=1 Tax=Streptomyces griseocarneus TaxID=51201 RepID=UPI00167DE9A8|nr:DUF3224 domain-containing protein [Streptomyces griseocarneus]MBZ6477932.1 DUF3224 domain-containing protein [Streptomyces griseocarneus]GHG54183.1 hypothetical protein GCM10018779_16910 [Streptomyces griseocarneus]
MPVRTTTGHFTFATWEERTVGARETSPRLAHASVVNTFSGGIEAADTTCEYTIAYATDKTGTFTGMQVLTGRVDGRDGTFVVEERGSFDDDGTVHCAFEVVPGTGTGELTGLRGTGSFVARHGEPSVPYTFDYEVG